MDKMVSIPHLPILVCIEKNKNVPKLDCGINSEYSYRNGIQTCGRWTFVTGTCNNITLNTQ